MLETKSFSFTADCKKLEAAIKRVASIMSLATSPTYYIAIYKKRVCVIGLGGETFALVAVPESTTKDTSGAFSFAPDVLPGLIRNRTALNFSFDGKECKFAQVKGSYKGNITTPSISGDSATTAEAFAKGKTGSGAKLSAEVMKLLRDSLALTSVKDVYQGMSLMSYIVADGKTLTVSSFDGQHFGLSRLKHKGLPSFRAALPATHFSLIDQTIDGADAEFSISSGSIRVEGKGFIVVLPATQAEDKHYGMVQSYSESLPKALYTCTYDNNQLLALTENLITLYNANTSFSIMGKKNELQVSFTTPSGTASDSMSVKPEKGSDKFKLGVDPRLLKDILSLAKAIKEPTLIINAKVIAIKGEVDGISTFLACARSE